MTGYTATYVICKATKEGRCDEISINDVKNSGYGIPPEERTLEKKEMLTVSDRSSGQVREAKYVGRRPQLGSKIVGSAEAAVGLSPEEIRARRNVACVAHKPLVVCFVPMRIYRGVRLGYLGVAIVIFP